jgi:hypothetical protein
MDSCGASFCVSAPAAPQGGDRSRLRKCHVSKSTAAHCQLSLGPASSAFRASNLRVRHSVRSKSEPLTIPIKTFSV